MPQLNFIRQGRGPVVVLAHALGLDLTQWDEVAPLLARHFTVLRYDQRGHGRSEAPPGPYTLEALNKLKGDRAYYISEIENNRREIEELKTNKKSLEKFAREKYHMKKDDEDVYVIVQK